jgi:23S rRNA (uridine2552-2'-O)-methyltransferase
MQRHINDPYVKQAQREGYRSRAAYKLLELLEKDRLIKPGMVVVDLGAAPGGWSQVAAKLVGDEGHVFALDILPMDALPGVTVIEGDFTEKKPHDALLQALGGRQVDVVISDIAPNITGMAVIDQPRSMYLCELALDFACNNLKPGGDFVAKVFQGEGFDEFYRELRSHFQRVVTRKPQASRAKSREVYVVARGLKV